MHNNFAKFDIFAISVRFYLPWKNSLIFFPHPLAAWIQPTHLSVFCHRPHPWQTSDSLGTHTVLCSPCRLWPPIEGHYTLSSVFYMCLYTSEQTVCPCAGCLIQKPSGWRTSVVVTNSDFPQPPEVRGLYCKLVLWPPFKVVFVTVQSSLSFDNKHSFVIRNTHTQLYILYQPQKTNFVASVPVSPFSPKIFRNTSASVPLPFISAVNTLTIYLFTAEHVMQNTESRTHKKN